jgi:hypothetical protein
MGSVVGCRTCGECGGSLPTPIARPLGHLPRRSNGRLSRRNQSVARPNSRNRDQDRLRHRYTRSSRLADGRCAENVNLILPKGKGFERRLMFQQPMGRTPPRPECIGQLQHCENPFVILLLALLLSDIRKQAEVVLLNGGLATARSEFALRTMLIEGQWRSRGVSLLSRYIAKYKPNLLNQSCQGDCYCCVLAAMNGFCRCAVSCRIPARRRKRRTPVGACHRLRAFRWGRSGAEYRDDRGSCSQNELAQAHGGEIESPAEPPCSR